MDPTELPAGVPTADRDLVDGGAVVDAGLHPGADGVRVGRRLTQAQRRPGAHRRRPFGIAGADVAPELGGCRTVDDDEVEQAVEVEVDDGGAARPLVPHDPGLGGCLHERAVTPAEQQVVGIAGRVTDLGLDVALGDEQVGQAVVVDVGELVVPRRRRQHVAADEGAVGGDSALERDVLVGRLVAVAGEGLQLVVGLTRQEHLGPAVAGQVVTGDAHPPDLQRTPPVGLRVGMRGLIGHDAPELLAAVAVVVPVVRHAQVAPAGPAPVAEQHRQRAVPGRQRDRRCVTVAGSGPQESTVPARSAIRCHVAAEREGGQLVRLLPRRAERDRQRVRVGDAERLVGPCEPAVAEPPQDHVLTGAQHGEVGVAVAVDVQGIGAGDGRQVGDR